MQGESQCHIPPGGQGDRRHSPAAGGHRGSWQNVLQPWCHPGTSIRQRGDSPLPCPTLHPGRQRGGRYFPAELPGAGSRGTLTCPGGCYQPEMLLPFPARP